MVIKFKTVDFMVGFAGGSFLTFILTSPCTKTGMFGSIFIGFVIGILFEEMNRYNQILEDDPNYKTT